MRMLRLAVVFVAVGSFLSCDLEDRTAKLEKNVQELQEKNKKQDATAEYDLQAKCAKDSKAWFNEQWASDKDTLLLTYTNHYNKASNSCFIFVEYHHTTYSGKTASSWMNNMSLWNIYENNQIGDISESHENFTDPNIPSESSVVVCEMGNTKCTTVEQFDDSARPYMSN
jgi:hypothetical protein